MPINEISFKGLKGVGAVDLKLMPNQRVYTFIGINGIGKTKCLEALFQYLMMGSEWALHNLSPSSFSPQMAEAQSIGEINYLFSIKEGKSHPSSHNILGMIKGELKRHNLPVIFIASQNRGHINPAEQHRVGAIGSFEERRKNYVDYLANHSKEGTFSNLNMNAGLEEWFITRAQSANPYQKAADNRRIEIDTVLTLMHEVDPRIDASFLEISGDNRVFIKIENERRELSHLSTGFAAILKMVQTIIAGYGNFTNENNLPHVRGVVLIDEIESHLHISWQTHIIKLFKRLLPNTTFYIATHSSMVLAQLQEGEAYRLERDTDGVVRSQLISKPNKSTMIDLLAEVFGTDLNQLKRDRMSGTEQREAKQRLLKLLDMGAE